MSWEIRALKQYPLIIKRSVNSFRSHIKNSCIVFNWGLQTPRNNKSICFSVSVNPGQTLALVFDLLRQKQKTAKTPALRKTSWNICTLCPGLSADLQLMDDSHKTAIINKELARLNIDLACLQETQLADSGSLMEKDYTFFWQGLSQDEPRQ